MIVELNLGILTPKYILLINLYKIVSFLGSQLWALFNAEVHKIVKDSGWWLWEGIVSPEKLRDQWATLKCY